MSRSSRGFIIRLFVFAVTLALVGADGVASAQNANSSTTQNENTSMQNENMSGTNMNRTGRSTGRRRGNANANTSATENTNMASGVQENANTTGAATGNMGGRRRGRRRAAGMGNVAVAAPVSTGRCDPNMQEQTDLSGTYTGTVNYSEGGMSGDATLTITGNNFTLTSGSSSQEGRVVAVTTCNYTAVVMRLGKDVATAPGQPSPPALPTISLTAKRAGGGLTLTSAPGESKQFSFTSSGGGGRPGGRRSRRPTKVAIKPPTVANRMKNAK